MHTIIQQRRRELGLTQEQVAEHLGVTPPAVSKWETGTTSPDIGLLPSLARLLKTDLNTLFSFREDLSAQEISIFCRELAVLAEKDIPAAFSMAQEQLRQFPYCEELLLNTAIVLDAVLVSTAPQDHGAYEEKLTAWYDRLLQSPDAAIRSGAGYMVVNRYIRQGELDMAQTLLDSVPDAKQPALPDKLTLQTAIHLKRQRADLAALELQRALYLALCRVQHLLTQLVEAENACGEEQAAEGAARRLERMTALFDLWPYTGYTGLFQLASSHKDAEAVLALMDQMLEALSVPWEPGASSLFCRIAPEMKRTDLCHLRIHLLKALETDPALSYLREHPACQDLLAKYRAF